MPFLETPQGLPIIGSINQAHNISGIPFSASDIGWDFFSLFVGTGGTLNVKLAGEPNTTVTFIVPDGFIFIGGILSIESGTDASDLVAIR